MNNELYSANDYRYYLAHHGIRGQKWYVRRFQNSDGSLTAEGRLRYGSGKKKYTLSDRIKKRANLGGLHTAAYDFYTVRGPRLKPQVESKSEWEFRKEQQRYFSDKFNEKKSKYLGSLYAQAESLGDVTQKKDGHLKVKNGNEKLNKIVSEYNKVLDKTVDDYADEYMKREDPWTYEYLKSHDALYSNEYLEK